MARLRVLSGKQVCEILSRYGFIKSASTRKPYCNAKTPTRHDSDRSGSKSFRIKDRYTTINYSAALGLSGGIIYDALIAKVAQKSKVERILTLNVRHFKRVWYDDKNMLIEP